MTRKLAFLFIALSLAGCVKEEDKQPSAAPASSTVAPSEKKTPACCITGRGALLSKSGGSECEQCEAGKKSEP